MDFRELPLDGEAVATDKTPLFLKAFCVRLEFF
jgi:hypothetical protein